MCKKISINKGGVRTKVLYKATCNSTAKPGENNSIITGSEESTSIHITLHFKTVDKTDLNNQKSHLEKGEKVTIFALQPRV